MPAIPPRLPKSSNSALRNPGTYRRFGAQTGWDLTVTASATQNPVIERAPAKINLNLHVTGRRSDGWHMIESFVAFADVSDVLTFNAAPHFSLEITGPFAAALPSENNLALKAARALRDGVSALPPGCSIMLEKNLPVASGIGGGSADAAAVLRALPALFDIAVEPTALLQLAAGLGADVPACLLARAAMISGTGTLVEPAPSLPEIHAVLVNPGIQLATGEIYAAMGFEPGSADPVTHPVAPPGPFSGAGQLVEYLNGTRNDFEPVVSARLHELGDVLEALFASSGCLLARMSGSGATCFGLFAGAGEADAAKRNIAARHQDWWVGAGRLE